MTLTKDQELVVNFYNNIGNAFKGCLLDIQEGPQVNNFIYKPDENFTLAKATKLAQLIGGRVRPDYNSKNVIFEIPKEVGQMIFLNKLLQSKEFQTPKATLPVVLGTDSFGNIMIGDLRRLPHLLIGGRTGTGKSVFMQSIITSLVQRFTPDECRLLLIDPKGVDFGFWDDIPHLLTPVIKLDVDASISALKWAVREMEHRFEQLQSLNAANIERYNEIVTQKHDVKNMPYIVIVIDEIADLMYEHRKEVEACVQKIAQKARAVGIHLIMATQRPVAATITGIMKANLPTRISFQTRNGNEANTILGETGSEHLLPFGDMLFSDAGRIPVRIHTAYISDEELVKLTDKLRKQGNPQYISDITDEADNVIDEELYEQAKEVVVRDKKPSISYIQRRLGIGYNKAASLIDKMEQDGIVSALDTDNKRKVL